MDVEGIGLDSSLNSLSVGFNLIGSEVEHCQADIAFELAAHGGIAGHVDGSDVGNIPGSIGTIVDDFAKHEEVGTFGATQERLDTVVAEILKQVLGKDSLALFHASSLIAELEGDVGELDLRSGTCQLDISANGNSGTAMVDGVFFVGVGNGRREGHGLVGTILGDGE